MIVTSSGGGGTGREYRLERLMLSKSACSERIGTDKEGQTVILTVLDPWDWEQQAEHLSALQAKLNSYFGFVESGQLFEQYPEATGKMLQIDVVGRYVIPSSAQSLLQKASAVASELNITVTHRMA